MKQGAQTLRDARPEGQRKIIARDPAINYCALRGEAEILPKHFLHPRLIEMPTQERCCCA